MNVRELTIREDNGVWNVYLQTEDGDKERISLSTESADHAIIHYGELVGEDAVRARVEQ